MRRWVRSARARDAHTYIFSSVRTKLFVGLRRQQQNRQVNGQKRKQSGLMRGKCYYHGLLVGRDTGSGTTFLCPVCRCRVLFEYDCFRFADISSSLFVATRHGIDTTRKHMFIMDVHDFECRWIWSRWGKMCTEWVDNKEEAHTKTDRVYINDVCMF